MDMPRQLRTHIFEKNVYTRPLFEYFGWLLRAVSKEPSPCLVASDCICIDSEGIYAIDGYRLHIIYNRDPSITALCNDPKNAGAWKILGKPSSKFLFLVPAVNPDAKAFAESNVVIAKAPFPYQEVRGNLNRIPVDSPRAFSLDAMTQRGRYAKELELSDNYAAIIRRLSVDYSLNLAYLEDAMSLGDDMQCVVGDDATVYVYNNTCCSMIRPVQMVRESCTA